eukprot:5711286-Alexandrium_andersonii.AAC.1
MSASLVGSEMCIRDRCGAWDLGSPRSPASGATSGPNPKPGSGLGAARGCLLYTSDAADDM